MKITVQVKAGAKTEEITKIDERNYRLRVKAPAKEGKANEAVIKALARHFKIGKSAVRIIGGLKSRKKIIELD